MINCLIVEDEPFAAELLQDYIGQAPFLKLAATCTDAVFALEILQQQKIDLIFLDIHLPRMRGLDFIKSLASPPRIIITSAYQEYALEGFDLNVSDYLLKPIEFSRFLKAVNKIHLQKAHPSLPDREAERPFRFFNVGKKKVKIYLHDIYFIESRKEYVKITASNNAILTRLQLGEIEELLKKDNFIRVHRSFIVAKDKVNAITATDLEIMGTLIPIGRNYKDLVAAAFE